MHTVELLEAALDLSNRLGYQVRHEWLGGSPGGGCQLKGRKMLFLDPVMSPIDQLDVVLETLRSEPAALGLPMAHELRGRLEVRRAA